jgi:ATP-dependent DNA helicase RecQ
MTTLEQAAAALKKYFGYDTFRPLQADVIQSIYAGKDVLVLMPTGGGKSVCYQIPAVTMPGTAVIVSPLIALMKDQVEGLSANGIPAAFINSSLSADQQRNVEDALIAGYIKLLYVSPEKLVSQGFQPLLKRLNINLFAIDEAHCISAWGHDFRPEYTQLQFLKAQFPQVPLIALTATADKLTRRDIATQLGIEAANTFISSFDRPNISLKIQPGQKRFEQIVEFLKKRPGQSGIIYCLARKTCQDLSEKLNAKGFKTDFYHAELGAQQRNKVQEDFINDRIPIICATIAFGMGIDKSNVRFVVHYNLPRNLEGYYQEVGRAGRDGLASEAVLFFSYGDVISYREMFMMGEGSQEQKDLKIKKLERMYEYAEAPVCRRRTVLAYFDEVYDRNCGNCDICLNPPQQFDGTVAAQKALSAIIRTGERVGMNMLTDILRGSQRREIFDQRFHEIKTYGAGKEFSNDDWLYLLSQMLHLGLIEMAYDQHNVLRVTTEGKKVLFEDKKVPLALPQPKTKPLADKKLPELKVKQKADVLRDELFDRLVLLRRQVAQQQGVPPYLVFSDVTLKEMTEKRPLADFDLLEITGVGPFQTFDLYKKGHSIEQIAEQRGLSLMSVVSHLATMYERGELLDIDIWVGAEVRDLVQGALPLFEEPYQLKAIHEHFQERFSFDEIRWAIADARRRGVV